MIDIIFIKISNVLACNKAVLKTRVLCSAMTSVKHRSHGRGSPCQKREKPRGGWKVCYWYVHIYIQSLMRWTGRESKTVLEYHVKLFATYMVSTRVGFNKTPLPFKLVPPIAFVHDYQYWNSEKPTQTAFENVSKIHWVYVSDLLLRAE